MTTHVHLDLAPPDEANSGSAVVLSLLAHLLLGAALAWGVNWTQSDPQLLFSAELWSPTAQVAAPAAMAPPPPPPLPAAVKPAPPPAPEARPIQPQADIAFEREQKRKTEQERRKADALKEKSGKEKPASEQADKTRKDEETRKLKDKEKERELAKTKDDERKEAIFQAAQDKLRQEQVQRIQGLAGATDTAEAKGSAQRSSAPTASYAGKIIEQVKNNTTFTDASAGRPWAVVLVKTSSSGLILSRRVVESSGNKAWDEAVLRAVDKMANVPRDTDGRIPEVLLQDGLEIKVTL